MYCRDLKDHNDKVEEEKEDLNLYIQGLRSDLAYIKEAQEGLIKHHKEHHQAEAKEEAVVVARTARKAQDLAAIQHEMGGHRKNTPAYSALLQVYRMIEADFIPPQGALV